MGRGWGDALSSPISPTHDFRCLQTDGSGKLTLHHLRYGFHSMVKYIGPKTLESTDSIVWVRPCVTRRRDELTALAVMSSF